MSGVAAKFITTVSSRLNSVNVVDGQVIALSDRSALYYDMGQVRHAVLGITYSTTNLPETGNADTLYVLTEADTKSGIYIYKDTSFVKVASLGETKEFTGASSSAAGTAGLVPAPAQTADTQVLTNNGNWTTVGNVISKNVASSISADDQGVPTAAMVHSYTNDAIAGVVQFKIEVVDTLPEDDPKPNTIYLVPNETSEDKNVKTEYMYIEGEWEILGSTAVDLENYVTTEEMSSAIDEIETPADIGLSVSDGKLCITYESD